ncbi:MAG: penicillin acylase family protein [Lysobacter sp.]|nr:penicillin acylase family protein [Lysobacter sp.]
MKKWLKRIALWLLVLIVVGLGTGWWLMRGSLPTLDGELALDGLSAPVTIQRDALGVVTIDAANEIDAMRTLGYVHAQERFFEMDLMRRVSTGELSELFGPIAIEKDKTQRVHRIRARVEADLAAMSADKRPQLQAYTDGVNAGLGALRVRPWPYLLLRQQPKRWELGDAALTGFAMYFDLQDAGNHRELALWKIKPHLPPALYALLTRDGTRWDAPLVGSARGDATLPAADEVDLRKLPGTPAKRHDVAADDIVPGSNNFAVSGALTADGRAIVADDMHLGLRAPGIWFRARLRYADPRAPGGKVDATGFTLPGLPAIVVGSNTHVAWAFTNSYVDTADWKLETACGAKPTDACVKPVVHSETIRVAGAAPVDFEVEETAWGPVLHHDGDTLFALRWNAHLKGALDFGLTDLLIARDLDQAMALTDRSAMPTQNLLIGDSTGRIAWRLIGPLAARGADCNGALPLTASQDCPAWTIATDRSPNMVDPFYDRLWSANNRTMDGTALAQVGDGGFAFGARARQIRNDLFSRKIFAERDLLAVQLDDRAVFQTQWWTLLRDTAARTKTPALSELSEASKHWEGRASVDSVSYRIVRAWRLAVHARVAEGLTAPAHAALGEKFDMPAFQQLEGTVWPLVTQRPPHLLSKKYATWDALLEDAAKDIRDELKAQGPLAQRTWGERNTAAICHPLAKAIPLIGKSLLCMPPDRLSGDGGMPRVVGPDFGASERMVVSPGHEADGITHMSGGQSGHPLSPFWGAGHDDWVHGRPTPFLPGKTEYTLKLQSTP